MLETAGGGGLGKAKNRDPKLKKKIRRKDWLRRPSGILRKNLLVFKI